ncbi:ABC transporter ATP-binding protein/permease [Devosia sp.]|uniref:ABC transporter ATP-binding protein/permease n=1 Tax=Devosia sp. TaxID=1871048 RepID=UPI002AFFF210|nr:SbmA/BacA-like family transporter [Devosia sp.]
MFKVLAQFSRLMALCLKGDRGKLGLLLFALVVGLELLSVVASLRLIQWTGDFYGALERLEAAEAITQVGIFALIVALNSTRHLTALYTRKHLEMRWRRNLTANALDIWLANKAYWHLSVSGRDAIDNPDQRIAEDCTIFLQKLLSEALDLISRVVGLFSYLVVLWSLAQFPLSLAFIGLPVEIPHYMIWAAFIYVALSSGLTHLLGKPLKPLLIQQQQREADFRFALARLRSNTDAVALGGGEAAERRLLDTRFEDVVANWNRLVRREIILAGFTFPFNHSVLRIPLFVALPGYLAGHVAFGGLMQLASAFSNVVTTLSWFIFSYRDLADLVAASSRLDGFLQAAREAGRQRGGVVRQIAPRAEIGIDNVAVATPDGRGLLCVSRMDIAPGETIWVRGASGLGKTTLLKALAGLWPFASGCLRCAGTQVFMPQRPYFPDASIYSALTYPEDPRNYSRADLDDILHRVGLGHRTDPDDRGIGTKGLSGGEEQRLALARLLVLRPQCIWLDEPTSALDAAAEADLFALLRAELPDSMLILVSHHRPHGLDELRILDLSEHPHDPSPDPAPALIPA